MKFGKERHVFWSLGRWKLRWQSICHCRLVPLEKNESPGTETIRGKLSGGQGFTNWGLHPGKSQPLERWELELRTQPKGCPDQEQLPREELHQAWPGKHSNTTVCQDGWATSSADSRLGSIVHMGLIWQAWKTKEWESLGSFSKVPEALCVLCKSPSLSFPPILNFRVSFLKGSHLIFPVFTWRLPSGLTQLESQFHACISR